MIYAIFILGMYFLPTLIAAKKNKRNGVAIFVLNIFFGWTVIGWFIALIWACTDDPQPTVIYYQK